MSKQHRHKTTRGVFKEGKKVKVRISKKNPMEIAADGKSAFFMTNHSLNWIAVHSTPVSSRCICGHGTWYCLNYYFIAVCVCVVNVAILFKLHNQQQHAIGAAFDIINSSVECSTSVALA